MGTLGAYCVTFRDREFCTTIVPYVSQIEADISLISIIYPGQRALLLPLPPWRPFARYIYPVFPPLPTFTGSDRSDLASRFIFEKIVVSASVTNHTHHSFTGPVSATRRAL